jgi:hypothetical protein
VPLLRQMDHVMGNGRVDSNAADITTAYYLDRTSEAHSLVGEGGKGT